MAKHYGILGIVFLLVLLGCEKKEKDSEKQNVKKVPSKALTKDAQNVSLKELKKKAKFRAIAVKYDATITHVKEGTTFLNIWIPLPLNNDLQEVKDITVNENKAQYEITTDPYYGNQMLYFRVVRPQDRFKITIHYKIRRWEDFAMFSQKRRFDVPWELTMLPTRNTPQTATIRERVEALTKNTNNKQEKVRLIFEDTLKFMSIDAKSQEGNYDKVFAAARGDSIDFHNYFSTHCRNVGVPCLSEFGVILPESGKGKVGAPVSWGYYRVGQSWFPVDCFSAKKSGGYKASYYCGNLDINRISFSRGRDIQLAPRQKGARIDAFVIPHAEADGKKHDQVFYEISYKEEDFE